MDRIRACRTIKKGQ
jgi:hypothetical protein